MNPRNAGRAALTPSSRLPLAYFAFAHASLGAALAALIAWPGLPGGFFYHPRMIAVVHLLTLGWISGSILGSFYVVAPLALVVPMPVRGGDWAAWAMFALGASGMVSHFWLGTYDGMAWSAAIVLAAVAWVGWRAWRGLAAAPVPAAIRAHVRLAFANMLAAGIFGILIGVDRAHGWLGWSPLDVTFAHAHVAAIGWAVMMIMGLGYRLLPMLLPSPMPAGRMLWLSAAGVEIGLVLLVADALSEWALMRAAVVLILTGLAAFVFQVARSARTRLPRPPSLPRRDWSVVQAAMAFVWLLAACALGAWLSTEGLTSIGPAWVYGTAGLLGFIGQMIAAMHGRLVPYYAWYRAMAARGGDRPPLSVHALTAASPALAVCAAWGAGVPFLACGLAAGQRGLIRAGAAFLLCGVVIGAAQIARTLRRAMPPDARP